METKTTLGLMAGIGALVLLWRGSRLSRFQDKMLMNVLVRIHHFSGLTLKLAVDATLVNPTNTRVRIYHPFVRVFLSKADQLAGKPLLTSTINNKGYDIGPQSEQAFEPIYLMLSLTDFNVGSAAFKMLKKWLSGQPVALFIEATSRITSAQIAATQTIEFAFQKNGGGVSGIDYKMPEGHATRSKPLDAELAHAVQVFRQQNHLNARQYASR